MLRPPRAVVRREHGLYTLERTLHRRGFDRVGGADEAGRGACAGPLVTAAVVLPAGKRGEVPGLADSKLLTPAARDRAYDEVLARAEAYSVVIVPAADIDARGLHRCNLEALRRALVQLAPGPDYVLTDGFGVDGTGVPALAVWKGDRVSACIAAASVLAKVVRDRIMTGLHEQYPEYDFAQHKGYCTAAHSEALRRHGPCAEHRMSYANVVAAMAGLPVDTAGFAAGTVGDPLDGELDLTDGEVSWRPGDGVGSGGLGIGAGGASTPAGAVVRDNGPVRDVTT
ncbi:MAG: ribonuclease [Cryptosporangiaceae bacterium]|nr:ribonuclease [Cryptosporangiaceae bacterium]